MIDNRYNELFKETWNNLDTWAKVAVHNYFVSEFGYGDYISDNTEDFINESFLSPFDVIDAIAHYSTNDDYAWIDDDGNLYSGDSERELPLSDVGDMAEYFYNHPSYLKDFREFNEWYDAIKYGFDDEENDEDEDDED